MVILNFSLHTHIHTKKKGGGKREKSLILRKEIQVEETAQQIGIPGTPKVPGSILGPPLSQS